MNLIFYKHEFQYPLLFISGSLISVEEGSELENDVISLKDVITNVTSVI